MAVLALMYHATPREPANGYDVGLSMFEEHMAALVDAGTSFIAFDEIQPRHITAPTFHVSVTFDDGDASNAAAFEILARFGIRPMAFIVSDWARGRAGYLNAVDIATSAAYCDFGGHGATHRDLTSLPDPELRNELGDSKAFLEDLLSREAPSMAAPGGRLDARVVRTAREVGFARIGNSIPLAVLRPEPTLNRLVVDHRYTAAMIVAVAARGRARWMMEEARVRARDGVARGLGHDAYQRLARPLKWAVSAMTSRPSGS